ncbi:MAG: T9SS type A sorting domain-containing protein [Bacteroidota bacterium]
MKTRLNFTLVLSIAMLFLGFSMQAQRLQVNGSSGFIDFIPTLNPFNNTTLIASYEGKNGVDPQLRFESDAAGFIDIGLDGSGNFVIENTDNQSFFLSQNGNVGIGTNAPDQKLHIARGISGGTANAGAIAIFEHNNTGYLQLLTPDTNESGILFGNATAAAAGGIIYNNGATSDGLQFRTNGNSTRMVIDASGDVGIGTNDPQAKLDVDGEVIVNGRISGVSDPIDPQDAATKNYVDQIFQSGAYDATWTTINGFTSIPSFTKCEYSRVGDLVTVVCRFGGSGPTYGSGTNTATITVPPNLPVANPAGGRLISGVFSSDQYRNVGDTETGIVCHQDNSTVQLKINGSNSGIAGSWCSFVYQTSATSSFGLGQSSNSRALNPNDQQLDMLRAENEILKAANEEIKARLAKIEDLLSYNTNTINTTTTLTSATLAQNAPNPFNEATTISYFIPEGTKNASLQVMDQNGRVIKVIPIQATGQGQITLQANLLSAGTYSYALILDGQVMTTKQMVLTR